MSGFDQLANVYEPLERMSFAGQLQEIRCYCIPHVKDSRRGLLLGDGDGRFSSALLNSYKNILLDSIDISSGMLELAQKRADTNSDRLRAQVADAIEYEYPIDTYDFIGLHFVLDCFSQDAIDILLPMLEASLKPGGLIAYSDFQANRFWQRLVVRCLYLAFRLGAGLTTSRLPSVKWSPQLECIAQTERLGGLLFSRVLRKS